jgi:Carbohydrate/starch-binding module (family 21)
MPSSDPYTSSPPTQNHRRSHSFSNEKRLDASVSLGALPKLASKKLPLFHFKDSRQDDSLEDDLHQHRDLAPLSIETHNLFTLHEGRFLANSQSDRSHEELTTLPFPKSSPPSCTPKNMPLLTASTSPGYSTLSCVSSRPILLSDGTRLKSSLRSMNPTHLRVKSVPATPLNVHFPERKKDGLESVRVFNLTAKPASLSEGGDITETETETETDSRFPFPRLGINSFEPGPFPVAFVIDYETPGATSTIPVPNPPPCANIYFESAALVQPETPSYPPAPTAPHLTGTILVRNIAYEKHVAVRFTLDEWQTTSEVAARHVVSMPVLPWEKTRSRTPGNSVTMTENANNLSSTPLTWDRFSFDIRLGGKLQERVLWFVGRYTATGEGGEEWWDNNSGLNFRVGFKAAAVKSGDRTGQTASAPGRYLTSPQATPSANRYALTQTINSSSYSPTQTRLISPPLASLALQRQAKLSLSNYAAPCLSPTSAAESLLSA